VGYCQAVPDHANSTAGTHAVPVQTLSTGTAMEATSKTGVAYVHGDGSMPDDANSTTGGA